MKQRITVEQLQELTEEQQQRLRDWWKPQKRDIAIITQNWGSDIGQFIGFGGKTLHFDNISSVLKANCLPLLSIGQMIELLYSRDKCINLTSAVFGLEADKFTWEIRLRQIGEWHYNAELCDALWDAVKEVL